jgi:hypothetical protein
LTHLMNRRDRNSAHQAAALAIDAVVPEGQHHLRPARSIINDELAGRPVLTAGTLWTHGTDAASGISVLTIGELLISTNDGPANGYYPSGLQVATSDNASGCQGGLGARSVDDFVPAGTPAGRHVRACESEPRRRRLRSSDDDRPDGAAVRT